MTAVAENHLDATAEAYRAEVVAAIGEHVQVLASFVLGSGLVGGYRPGRSDLDLVVVVDAPLRGEARRAAIERIAALELPGRRLELVVYVHGHQPPDFDLNLEVDADGARGRQPLQDRTLAAVVDDGNSGSPRIAGHIRLSRGDVGDERTAF